MNSLYWLDPADSSAPFPPVNWAMREPDGLLAAGGDLAPERLINAYRQGIFPWYNLGQPILWWSPSTRAVLFPARLKVSHSLRKTLKRQQFTWTLNAAFRQVIAACAAPRSTQRDTWITPDMMEAYGQLHELGWAHSVEVWQGTELVGGLYGVAIGKVFFGESMFSRARDSSKVAFVHLARTLEELGYVVIDCQVGSAHLQSLGAENMPRGEFTALVAKWCNSSGQPAPGCFKLSPATIAGGNIHAE